MIPSFPLLGRTFTIYPLMALVGMFASGIYACRSAKRAGQNEDDMIVLLLVSSLGVFLGMHLLYGLVGHIPVASAPGSDPLPRLLLPGDGHHLGRLRILRRPSGGHPGGRCIPAPEGAALGPLGQPDSPGHPPLSCFWPGRMLPGRMLLRPSLCLGLCLPVQPCGRGQWRLPLPRAAGGSGLESGSVSASGPAPAAGQGPAAASVSGPIRPCPVPAGISPRGCLPGHFPGVVHLPVDQPVPLPRRSVCPASPQELTKISHPPLFLPGDLWYTEGQKPENLQEEPFFADLR